MDIHGNWYGDHSEYLNDVISEASEYGNDINNEKRRLSMEGICYGLEHISKHKFKEPCRTSIQTGSMWLQELLDGHALRFHQQFRMSKDAFRQLCNTLTTNYDLKQFRNVSVEESVAMFLYELARGCGNRDIQERFQHSGETVSRHFHAVLDATTKMAKDIITPHFTDDIHPHIMNNPNYFPYFKDCVGALDGTHIEACISETLVVPYIGRKGTTQNVLGVCDFDMCFTFVSTGWDDSMRDTRILTEVLNEPQFNFPKAPQGKYYLVDSGYPNRKGFLAPYKGDRYHLPEFWRGEPPRNAEERFNYMHSSLRSVIERTFGCWKSRWKILKFMKGYDIDTQSRITGVSMALHNFIRKVDRDDHIFRKWENMEQVPWSPVQTQLDEESNSTTLNNSAYMNRVRDEICTLICSERN